MRAATCARRPAVAGNRPWPPLSSALSVNIQHFFFLGFFSFLLASQLLKSTIGIAVAPKVVPFSAPANLQQGERTTLTCTVARGDSPLSLQWMKDGKAILPAELKSVKLLNFDEFNSMLTIESLSIQHIGNYSCLAANLAGESSVSTNINVNGDHLFLFSVPPVLAPFNFGSTISFSQSSLSSILTVGTRTRVLCGLARGDTPVNFSWLRNARPLTTTSDKDMLHYKSTGVTITTVDDFSSLLTIARLGRGHAGNYTCLASNEAGSDQFTAILEVQGDLQSRY
jgi:Down syndrome cell adhesion protein 1